MGRKFMTTEGKEVKRGVLQLLTMLHKLNKMSKILKKKYFGYDVNGHRGVAQGKYDGPWPVTPELKVIKGDNPHLKDLSMPFSEFLKLNKCEEAATVWRGPFTAFGYGYFDEIPAAYVVKYLDAFTVRQFLKTGKLWTWATGTQSIWEGVNKHLKHPAILNSEVTKVERKDG